MGTKWKGMFVAVAALILVLGQGKKDQIDTYLRLHNGERQKSGLPGLVWDDSVAAYAKWWATRQLQFEDCKMRHSDGPYGENLFWGSKGKAWDANDAVQSWVEEKQHFSYETNSCRQMCGHYTQVVWKSTQKLGCAQVVCPGQHTLIVCNYDPPGNYIGERPF